MARMPSLIRFLIWTSSIPIAASHSVRLGGDIASLVPSCAQQCLASFIATDYPTAECKDDATLPCLCPAQSLSGFTVGEAALQCLFGYIQIGRCDKRLADDATPARVLNMCSGQESALPHTHATLTATLVIPPTGVPVLALPTSSHTQTLTSSTQTSTRTTMKTSTSSATRSTSTTSALSSSALTTTMVMTSLPTTIPTSISTATPTSSAASGSTSEPSSATKLAPAQIAGISVGVAGALALAVGAILLARCLRRRKYPDEESTKNFFGNHSTGSFDPLTSRGSRVFHISPPVLRTSKYRHDFFARPAPPTPEAVLAEPQVPPPSVDRNTIGLAISRPRSLIPPRLSPAIHSPAMSTPRHEEVPLQRKPSRLLPPRPALTIDIPLATPIAGAPSSQGPLTKDRASTLTNMTAFADLDLEAAEGEQTWRPPPSDPLSATTLYVADKYGNWVLSNNHRRSQIAQVTQPAELDTYTPLTKSPVEKREETAKIAAALSATTATPNVPPPKFLSQDPANRTYSQSSSSYSQNSSARHSGRRNSSGRNSASRSRKGSNGSAGNRSDSKDSITTIQTSSTGGNGDGFYENDVARLSQLSPVVESPAPMTGRSRVTYPKIPGRLDGATIRYVPPPRRPDFAGMSSGQPSPTLGVVYPLQGSPSAYPLPLNPRRPERQLAPVPRSRTEFTPGPEPEPRPAVRPGPGPRPRPRLELPNVEVYPIQNLPYPSEETMPEPYPRSDSPRTQSTVSSEYADSPPRNPFSTPTQQTIPTFTPSPLSSEKRTSTPPPPQPRIMDRGRPQRAYGRAQSGGSFQTVSSTTSSLLAKRVGSDKAAALALDPSGERAQQWRRQGGDGGFLSPDDYPLSSPRGTLPQTPIWQPKLTPTRRGDDLFLNVQ